MRVSVHSPAVDPATAWFDATEDGGHLRAEHATWGAAPVSEDQDGSEIPPSATLSAENVKRAELDRILSNIRFLRAHGHLRMKSLEAKPRNEIATEPRTPHI
jgi:hypothetical protein